MSKLPLAFDDNGLVPVIVQDHLTGENPHVRLGHECRRAKHDADRAGHFLEPFSRGSFWKKGR